MLKQSLNQRLLQKLSPQQIQLMKLLQIPTATLDQRIKEELEANPALDEGEEVDELNDIAKNSEESYDKETDSEGNEVQEEEPKKEEEFELDDYLTDYIEDDPSSYKLRTNNYSSDDEEKTIPIAVEDTFHEYLEQQLGMLNIKDERELKIAKQIIGSIDDDGYLRRDPESIIDDLVFSQNITTSETEIVGLLKQIQRFDPPGIGSRDLRECLILQLEIKAELNKKLSDEEAQIAQLAYRNH